MALPPLPRARPRRHPARAAPGGRGPLTLAPTRPRMSDHATVAAMDGDGRRPPGGSGQRPGADDMVRKTSWIERWADTRLREKAFESGGSEAEIVREAIRRYFEEEDARR